MRLYRRTYSALVPTILENGFRDSTGTYSTTREWTGVWFSDSPIDANEGAEGNTVLEVLLNATEESLADWEWIEEGKSYREWLIPAAVINPLVMKISILPG
jgi:hypothetical protein